MDIKDAFRILGIESSATDAEVKEAYRDCVSISHPDLHTHHPRRQLKATEQLKQINLAYEMVTQFRKNSRDQQLSQKNYSKHGGGGEKKSSPFTQKSLRPVPEGRVSRHDNNKAEAIIAKVKEAGKKGMSLEDAIKLGISTPRQTESLLNQAASRTGAWGRILSKSESDVYTYIYKG
ncbi:MAG: J domain-containing protein [Syntrophobacteraceae bacterium]|nr:J domain-containing protein [Syntrophobacteraceae bacterium]